MLVAGGVFGADPQRAGSAGISRRTVLAGWGLLPASWQPIANARSQPLSSIRIRDPFVLADAASKTYYLYAQMGNRLSGENTPRGVEVYTSDDLVSWRGPQAVFTVRQGSWARLMVWAPEVHAYRGNYYLFVTLTSASRLPGKSSHTGAALHKRGTQVLVADSPLGPFRAFQNRAHTPEEWSALDGTLWVEDGVPWMVFCHEWTQVQDGTVELLALKDDLSGVAGKPVTLFRASDAGWIRSITPKGKPAGYVTDGPFLHRTRSGNLLMVWSSFGGTGYSLAVAESRSRKVRGPWTQRQELLFHEDGGHGMIFRDFSGRLMLALHQPNRSPAERARFFELEDRDSTLRVRA